MIRKVQIRLVAAVFLTLIMTHAPISTFAEPVYVSPSSVSTVRASSGKEFDCSIIGGRVVAGRFDSESGLFHPLRDKLATLKAKAKKARGAALSKLNRSISKLKTQISQGTKACKTGGAPPAASPNNPGATPTPTAAPNNPASTCFIGSDTTCFGIPLGLAGNKLRGQSYHNAACGDCHIAKTGRSYSVVRDACKGGVSEMVAVCGSYNNQKLADLTAYLNRPR